MRFPHRAKRQAFPLPPVAPYPGAFGDAYLPADPLRATAAWRSVMLLSGSISMLPLDVYETRADGSVSRVTKDIEILQQPSTDADIGEFTEMATIDALVHGNAVGLIARTDGTGRPTQIELQSYADCQIVPGADSQPVYLINGEAVPRARVWHFRGPRRAGSMVGLSPIAYHAATIGVAIQAQRFGLRWFTDSSHPPYIYQSDQRISDTQADEILRRINAKRAKREPLILGMGLHQIPNHIPPNESQFLDTMRYGVSDIARIYGVPAEMIGGDSGGMTYSNLEQRFVFYLVTSLQPWLRRWERSLGRMLPSGLSVRFNTRELLRTDTLTRMQANAIGIKSHQITPDEARAEEGRAPLTEEQQKELGFTVLGVRESVEQPDPLKAPQA